MRITNSMITSTMLLNLNRNLNKLDKWNKQMATGKKFAMPSDDPIGVSKSLELRSVVSEIQQYKKNAKDAKSWLEITESAVQEVGDILQRARELAVSADGVETPEDKQKIQVEIEQLKKQLIKIANTTYAGKNIFSGYKTDKPLLGSDGEYLIDSKDSELIKYQIGVHEEINVNTLGHKLFGITTESGVPYTTLDNLDTNEASSGTHYAQLIKVFDDFSDALKNNDEGRIQKTLSRFDVHLENVLSIRGEIGARMNRMEMTLSRLDKDELNFTELLSKNEDADMAEVIMNMKMDESVYRASLSIGAKVIQPTLVDFIR
ncbi:flagellar hook-associated protein FlgL [Caminicella sporogenes]|uniref:flagellar hook-associated protein FlgL n=1 Tax=Caminicella sporogenes TaxID=166485 RepID=UPI0025425534|nr:flagellar hook-associated protein FlgL [Caminicella sporogenes]WIF96130.1 flagellar hook-associated protein FlgL [Caminicella sporogenes]